MGTLTSPSGRVNTSWPTALSGSFGFAPLASEAPLDRVASTWEVSHGRNASKDYIALRDATRQQSQTTRGRRLLKICLYISPCLSHRFCNASPTTSSSSKPAQAPLHISPASYTMSAAAIVTPVTVSSPPPTPSKKVSRDASRLMTVSDSYTTGCGRNAEA